MRARAHYTFTNYVRVHAIILRALLVFQIVIFSACFRRKSGIQPCVLVGQVYFVLFLRLFCGVFVKNAAADAVLVYNSSIIPYNNRRSFCMAENKTNAMRMLDRAKVPYTPHTYETDGEHVDGITVATSIGEPLERVYKTLVTAGKSGGHYVFVIPVAAELDLKKAAKAVGEKSVQMIHVKDINKLTGYIRGGCSPIGMKKQFPTVLSDSARDLPTVIVSGGRIGFQVELEPNALLKLIRGQFGDIEVK